MMPSHKVLTTEADLSSFPIGAMLRVMAHGVSAGVLYVEVVEPAPTRVADVELRLIQVQTDVRNRYETIVNRIAKQELELAALSSHKSLEPSVSQSVRETVNFHRHLLEQLLGDRAKTARRLTELEKRVEGRKKARRASPR